MAAFRPIGYRRPYFREVVGQSLASVEFSPIEGRPLKWAVDSRSFDGLTVVSLEVNCIRAYRSPSHLVDGNDDLRATPRPKAP
jgi:hypothetical protein